MKLELADLLDALIGDPQATATYAQYVLKHAQSGHLLELACGTGSLAQLLCAHFTVEGLDVDPAMIRHFQEKNPGSITHTRSMIDLTGLGLYDVIVCFGDSLNYVLQAEDVERLFREVHTHLKPGGVFLVDAHTEARLTEFETEYLEEGYLGSTPYLWSIQTLPDNLLDHHVVFYDAHGVAQRNQIIQRVYSLEQLKQWLEAFAWTITVSSDFVEGTQPHAEKYMLACRKEPL
jgi:cyclopropane fatty-acyl-phospholipid synthase-like methyltransferase